MKKKLIISTKRTGLLSKFGGVFLGIAIILMGFIILMTVDTKPQYISNNTEFIDTVLQIIPYFITAIGVLCIAISVVSSKAYVDIYDDHIEGKAFMTSNWNCEDFYLTYDKINNITTGRIKNIAIEFNGIFIHTINGTYRIPTNKKFSKEIFRHFNDIQ
ncbi:MAG: hypothetical protein E7394_03485 [Ruminococcaceae bacterium]|nr:hypothetical protein [Oscillospiraceae bacterium]